MSVAVVDRQLITATWVRNKADELAVAAGCWFDPAVGGFPVWWIERYCKLYEGEQAGEPMLLHGCHECAHAYGLGVPDDWGDEAESIAIERARRHAECHARGHFLDWQYDFFIRLFSWLKHSERWNRPIRRFRKGSLYVPKKNKKSPTLAALGLYLTCADGEQGQKTYFGAKDGSQAREIAGKHAMEMVLASPELTDECDTNKSLMQITHLPTRSILKPISSGDSRAQKSKEGLNGSVLVDETHVVDREFIGRISRAGISRSEPLHVEVSTAGDDPESYGKERYDAGKVSNDSGDPALTDITLLFVCYEAPQDLSDADLAADPVKFGKLANPAWGHTVGEEEFLADYHASKLDSGDLGRFRMYRLNIWQRASTPWKAAMYWPGCHDPATDVYVADDLAGKPCYGGLDLGKTEDTSAFPLLFPWKNDTYRLWVYYWLPDKRADELRDKVKYRAWADAGHITLFRNSNTVDYNRIRQDINGIRKRVKLKRFAYDGMYAEQMVQRMTEEEGLDPDVPLLFRQTIMSYAAPMAATERLLAEGKIRHPNNPAMNWQIGNVAVKFDNNDNRRPVKQNQGSWKTIDGPVGLIMAVAAATMVDTDEWYKPGILRD